MGVGQGGGCRCHQQKVERVTAEGEDWEGPHPIREREPSGGDAEGKWSEAAGESEKSTGPPWEQGEGGSRGEEGGQGEWKGMLSDERGRYWRVWGAGGFQEVGGDEFHRHYFEGKFLLSAVQEKEEVQNYESRDNSLTY